MQENLSQQILVDVDVLQQWAAIDSETLDLNELESNLELNLEKQVLDTLILENDRKMIGNPNSLGQTVMDVIWEQFIIQIGVVAGEDFIRENRGLTLDLRNDAHIQTTENFAKGNVATHNVKIDYQKRYNDWQNNFQRNEDGSIKTRYDRINNEYVAVLRNNTDRSGNDDNRNYNAREYIDSGRPKGSASMHKDHTIPAAEIIRDPETNAHLSREEQADFANSEVNLGDLDASANESKKDHKMEPWLDSERNGQKPAERFNIDEKELRERGKKADKEYEKRKKEGEQRSIETGKQSQRAEAFRISGKALRAAIMGLLASFIKDVIRKLISWFRSGARKFSTFISYVKEAIKSFFANLKKHLYNAGEAFVSSIAAAIYRPVIGMLKKAWMFLKQGYKSLKEAVDYIKNPANKKKSFGILMLEVGKIVIAGMTAGGAIVMGELIEKGLMAIPIFAFEIPMFGSLANIIGVFLGALVSGVIGAIALHSIDKMIAKQQMLQNQQQQIEKCNEILTTQEQLIAVGKQQSESTRMQMIYSIQERHAMAMSEMRKSIEHIIQNSEVDFQTDIVSKDNESLDQIFVDLQMS